MSDKVKWFLMDAGMISLGTVLLGYKKSKQFFINLFDK